MRSLVWIALALAACSDDGVSANAGSVTWGDRTVDREEAWELDRLVLRAGARITVRDGAYLRVRAAELVIEGRVDIDARGEAGAALTDPVWTSSGGALDDCEIAHRDWAAAVRDQMLVPLDSQNRGRPGRAAARVTVIARRVIGQTGDLHVDVRGGAGGRGRTLVCGCADHPNDRFESAPGPPGEDGRWTFVQE
jgi:hypothetical protein